MFTWSRRWQKNEIVFCLRVLSTTWWCSWMLSWWRHNFFGFALFCSCVVFCTSQPLSSKRQSLLAHYHGSVLDDEDREVGSRSVKANFSKLPTKFPHRHELSRKYTLINIQNLEFFGLEASLVFFASSSPIMRISKASLYSTVKMGRSVKRGTAATAWAKKSVSLEELVRRM